MMRSRSQGLQLTIWSDNFIFMGFLLLLCFIFILYHLIFISFHEMKIKWTFVFYFYFIPDNTLLVILLLELWYS